MNKYQIIKLKMIVFITVLLSLANAENYHPFPEKLLIIIDLWNYENPVIGNKSVLTTLKHLTNDEILFLKEFLHVKDDNFLLIRSKSKDEVISKEEILYKIEGFLKKKIDRESKHLKLNIYYSGHGASISDPNGNKIRCLLTEESYFDENTGNFKNYISEREFYDLFLNLRNMVEDLNIYLYLDACYQTKKKFKSGDIIGWNPFSEQSTLNKTWEDAADFVFAAGFGKVPQEKSLIKKLIKHQNELFVSKLTAKDLARIFPKLIYYNTNIENKLIRSNDGYVSIEFLPDFLLEIDDMPAKTGFKGRIKAGKHIFKLQKMGIFTSKYIAEVDIMPEANTTILFKDFKPISGKLVFVPNNPDQIEDNAIALTISDQEVFAKFNSTTKKFEVNKIMPGEYGNIYYDGNIIWKHLIISSGDLIEIPFTYNSGYNLKINLTLSNEVIKRELNKEKINKLIKDTYDANTYYCLTNKYLYKFILNEISWKYTYENNPLNIIQTDMQLFIVYENYFEVIKKSTGELVKKYNIPILPFQTPSHSRNSYILISTEGILSIHDDFQSSYNYLSFIKNIKALYSLIENMIILIQDDGYNDKILILNIGLNKIVKQVKVTGKINSILAFKTNFLVNTSDGIYVFDKSLNRLNKNRILANLNVYYSPVKWEETIHVIDKDKCYFFKLKNENNEFKWFRVPRIVFSNYIQFQNYICYLSPFNSSTIVTAVDIAEHTFDTFMLENKYDGVIGLSEFLVLYNDSEIHMYPVLIK